MGLQRRPLERFIYILPKIWDVSILKCGRTHFGGVFDPPVQFSCSFMSDSSQSHGMQHATPPCPSPTFGVHPNSCPLSRWPFNYLILCCPLLLSPSIFPSIGVFSNESALHIRWSKYWSFSLSISLSNEPSLKFVKYKNLSHFITESFSETSYF